MTVDKNNPRLNSQERLASNSETNTSTIVGGKYAVYSYKGYPQLIYSSYQSFFCFWLTATNNRLDNRCAFDIYRVIDCKSGYIEMDICFPLV